jgi:hypothetical protein
MSSALSSTKHGISDSLIGSYKTPTGLELGVGGGLRGQLSLKFVTECGLRLIQPGSGWLGCYVLRL